FCRGAERKGVVKARRFSGPNALRALYFLHAHTADPPAMSYHLSPGSPVIRQTGRVRAGWLLSLLFVCVIAAGAWWWWAQRGPASGGAQAGASASGAPASAPGRRFTAANRVQPVSVAVARRQDVRVMLAAIGNISALNTATVRARVDGELRAIRFKEGDMVRAGQLLAEIDPRSFEIQLAQAQGQLARDQAQLRNAQIDLERYRDLLAKDSIARQQVDTQAALVQQLQATVQSDQAQVDNARLQLSFTKVTAPISGRLGLKQADLGNLVRASDAAGIVSITQTQPISVVFAVPETNLPLITRKLKAGQPLGVEAWDREQRVRLAIGRVSTTDNSIDAVTGTIKLKAEFRNADGQLFPNQFVNVRLQVDTLEGATTVPTNAVQRGAQGTFVYVVKDDGTVTMRRIRLGATENEWVSVQGEVAPGQRVVIDGADRLREGAKVEVIAAAPRPGAAGQGRGPRDAASGAAAGAASGATAGPAAPDGSAQRAAPQAAAKGVPGAAPAGGASGGRALGSGAADAPDGPNPPWLSRATPEVAERYRKMTPEQRTEFVQKMRERRQQMQRDAQ
ncbi:MAG: MdtA/MuxA family multidrug efflux RND transporter periplasmic adaptor subunit, partial [Reyranella sp.]|nr:MdtA/MuxA family multidrug efflux RND transporter periplasmic adaptor subunit [Reyranella sp.]